MRSLARVIALCSAALFVPLAIPLATGRVFTLDDLGRYHIPMRYVYSEALHQGDSILWTPAVFSGFYLFGEGQLGMAHPWHLLLYRFFPLVVAVNLELITSYVAMFAGVVLLLERFGFSRESRWFGAMVFTFSGYNLYHVVHLNLIAGAAHIPWLMLAAHVLVTERDRKTRAWAAIALSLLFASQVLTGHLQETWMGLLAVGGMCLYLLWKNASAGGMALIAGALIVGGLVGGVQLLPLLDAVRSSQRTVWSLASSLSFSLAPVDIVQLWAPVAFDGRPSIEELGVHEFIVYNGAFCTAAIAWVALRRSALERSRLAVALLIFAMVGLLLAFGKYTGLYPALLTVPGLRWFRAPSRHLILYHLSISILAAMVFADLAGLVRRGERIAVRRLWPLALPSALAIAMAITTWKVEVFRGFRLAGASDTMPWVLMFLVVLFLFAAAARGAHWALPLLVVAVAVDQGFFGFHYVYGDPLQPMRTIDALAARAPTPEHAQPGDLLQSYRGYGLENAPILRGFRVWPGYVGLTPSLTLPPESHDLVTQRIAGTKWSLTRFPVIEPIPDPAARARLLSNAKVSSNMEVDVRTIDILTEALIDQPIEDLAGPPGSARVVEDRPGRMTVETTASGRQLVALTERFDPGWRADGCAPLRVYGDFLGCVVDAGTHRVTFRFRPRSFDNGLIATAIGLLLVLCMVPVALLKSNISRL